MKTPNLFNALDLKRTLLGLAVAACLGLPLSQAGGDPNCFGKVNARSEEPLQVHSDKTIGITILRCKLVAPNAAATLQKLNQHFETDSLQGLKGDPVGPYSVGLPVFGASALQDRPTATAHDIQNLSKDRNGRELELWADGRIFLLASTQSSTPVDRVTLAFLSSKINCKDESSLACKTLAINGRTEYSLTGPNEITVIAVNEVLIRGKPSFPMPMIVRVKGRSILTEMTRESLQDLIRARVIPAQN